MKIKETLKNLRKNNGLNQYELAEATKVSVDTVRRWEKGTQVPRADELVRLAKALNVTEAELLNCTNDGKIKVTISYDWEKFEKGEINMDGNLFELFLGKLGEIGIKGAGLPKNREELEELEKKICADLESMFELQVKRGAIQPA